MLKNLFIISSFLMMTLVICTGHSIAGRHFSKDERQDGDLSLEEAKAKFASAPRVREILEAYEDLRRFEIDEIWQTEVDLAKKLFSMKVEEPCKMAVRLYGRAMLVKNLLDIKDDELDINELMYITYRYLSFKEQHESAINYANSLTNQNIKQIKFYTFNLLEKLKDIPEAYEIIFQCSFGTLNKINSDKSFRFLKKSVEKKNINHPFILEMYINYMTSTKKAIPFPPKTVKCLYQALFKDDRFKFDENKIMDYVLLCLCHNYASDARDVLLEILKEGTFDPESTNRFQFALAKSYSDLNEHEAVVSFLEKVIPSMTDKAIKNGCYLFLIHHLYKLGNSKKGNETIQEMAHSSLSHLSAQRNNTKEAQRKRYIEAIKYHLAQKEKEETALKENNRNEEKRKKPSSIIASEEIRDSFLPEAARKSSQPKPPSRVKQKTRKQADPALNRKRDPEKFRKKGEKEKKEDSVKKIDKYRTAEELPNGPYKTLVKIFRIFVREVRSGSCKIMVEKVGHLFESLGHTYSKARGHGGHSMILCENGEKEEDAQRKAFTFGSKKKLNPAAIIDIASYLLEYRIYPEQFEKKLKDLL